MRKLLLLVCVIGVVAAPSTPRAQAPNTPDNVQQLLNWCSAPPLTKDAVEAAQGLWCSAYISGVMRYMSDLSGVAFIGSARNFVAICVGSRTTTGAGEQAFVSWAAANPKDWPLDPAEGVALALQREWPCHFTK